MELKQQTCCFTGHRIIAAAEEEALFARTTEAVEALIAKGYTRFASGGALGFDQLAARVVLKLKNKYPDIRLIMVLPCLNQAAKWSPAQAALYGHILSRSDEVTYTSQEYTRACMFIRNRALVDMSSVCLSYQTHDGGGTAYTVKYARQRGREVINVAP